MKRLPCSRESFASQSEYEECLDERRDQRRRRQVDLYEGYAPFEDVYDEDEEDE